MEPIEHVTRERLRREEAADRLRGIADELARHNELSFDRGGVRHTVAVPDQIELKVEIEVSDEKSEVELELSW